MEPSGATYGNRRQMSRLRKRLKQADPQPVAASGNDSGAMVRRGSTVRVRSEGLKDLQIGIFCCLFRRVPGRDYGGGQDIGDLRVLLPFKRALAVSKGTLREHALFSARWFARNSRAFSTNCSWNWKIPPWPASG